ncbi:hypothetical protein [Nocardia xishanensis]
MIDTQPLPGGNEPASSGNLEEVPESIRIDHRRMLSGLCEGAQRCADLAIAICDMSQETRPQQEGIRQ